MNNAWFVTGTDTEIGKTFTTCALLHAARLAGQTAVGMKPVAAGTDAAGRNEDVEQLLAASHPLLPRETVNPYLFRSPIAPHLAAREEGREISFAPIREALNALRQEAEAVLVEGVGGFRVPLGPEGDSADLAVALGLPVILVAGMRLGCINHVLLTAEAIERRGLTLAGWVANSIDPAMARRQENIATLQTLLPAPLLGIIDYQPSGGPGGAALGLRLPD